MRPPPERATWNDTPPRSLPIKGRGVLAALLIAAVATPAAAQDKKTPYWASIASGQAMMRTGPAKNYPGIWLYQRRDLPVIVLKRYESWRLVRDPDGAQGWMLSALLSDRRTAIVRPGEPRNIHVEPTASSPVRYRAEHGVVGKISKCADGWCRIEVQKRQGYIRTADIWGVEPNEVVE